MVKNTPQYIENLVNELYTRIIVSRTTTGYYYQFDNTYQGNSTLENTPNNITQIGNSIIINLYQVSSL